MDYDLVKSADRDEPPDPPEVEPSAGMWMTAALLVIAAALTWYFAFGARQTPPSGTAATSAPLEAPGPSAPQLEIDAPVALAAPRARLQSFDPQRLAEIPQLVGLADPGPPIRVMLASETSEWAHRVPEWTAGLALSPVELVVLFPERAPRYPHDTLEDVLRHEVAHVLITRAAGGRPVPQWFHEGLAMAAERGWGLEDRTRLLYELTLTSRMALDDIDDLFSGGRRQKMRAYSLAGALVRDLLDREGVWMPGEILRRVAAGMPFETAFLQATGITVLDAEALFWQRQRLWTTWVPFITSSTVVWMLVTLLALYAIRRRRQKSAALRKRWAEEEDPWSEAPLTLD